MPDPAGAPAPSSKISLTRTFCFDYPRSEAMDEELLASATAEVLAEIRLHHPRGRLERMTHRFERDGSFPGLWLLRTYAEVVTDA